MFSSKAPHSVPDTIASGDLDGDMYFVTWDPSLIPVRDAAPLNRTTVTGATVARKTNDMPHDAVKTFVQLKFNRLLGMMANEWTKQIELTPQLANGPYPMALVPLIESALVKSVPIRVATCIDCVSQDLMKTGEDFALLERQFQSLKNRQVIRNLDQGTKPIQRLRYMIPPEDNTRQTPLDGSKCDPALILREEDTREWTRHQNEASRVMRSFNLDLKNAMDLDKGLGQSSTTC